MPLAVAPLDDHLLSTKGAGTRPEFVIERPKRIAVRPELQIGGFA